ncbi:ferrous iron transporter B [Massilia antarctica]|uniref:ferrous iron transporter B n=1 Tax=Massilia antarctica TaxID=2765360 RepID=UPI0006BB86C2|nr:ferrous iron transporter B [Massilia sp. H27-R4]MCY0915356.1 ferrous iron transporter B [Massilia sp. H27-R4]CUI05818.1 Ferrous iron transport protein B [Janthinobacterium sp. CG23_2]CUU29604.1 Ferrous iron transport protein B [Janthinobacterium sp. CG23_2]
MGAVEPQVQAVTRTPLIALLGNPNCGKTALFNRLTGARQKVANYAGVTIERKEGSFTSPAGRAFRVLDLPGAYSLSATTPDEAITRDVVGGLRAGEQAPDAVVCVVNATNLRLNLRLVLEIRRLGLPIVLALNMVDVAHKRGIKIDSAKLAQELGMTVVDTVAVQSGGEVSLLKALDLMPHAAAVKAAPLSAIDAVPVEETQREVRRILDACVSYANDTGNLSEKIDDVVLHPVFGPILLAALMFLVFQAVFSWAAVPMEMISGAVEAVGAWAGGMMSAGMLRSLLVEGILGGVGSVLVFLPQILILFFFILVLEDCGYLPRAAFLLDRVMGGVGLSGRAFIPLLSSFACAIPGVMAARTIQNPRDRLVTIMIAPLMTCSARLPVYALIIAAFIPNRDVGAGLVNLQGLVLFILYFAGIISAMGVAWVIKRFMGANSHQPLMLELPSYHWPHLRNLALGLWERAKIFLVRVGTVILALMVLLWFLSSFPGAPEGATHPPIYYSIAGMLGRALAVVFGPIGFGWQICIALVPGMAAREVAVGALGTVYALSQTGDELATTLAPIISHSWSLPTALSLLAWYVFAPQCIATLSVVRRETGSVRYAFIMAGYMFALAYTASFITYRVAIAMGA